MWVSILNFMLAAKLIGMVMDCEFNRDEYSPHFPGYLHSENDGGKKNSSKLFTITERAEFGEQPCVFPEFSIVFLIV